MAAVPMRARFLLLASAGVVVLVVGGYFVAGYLRQRAVRKDLPAKLGLDIQQDSTGFTVSKSENGHTIFTLHAARAVQFRSGGDARLKDVRITLYGPAGSQRQDRISGAEFAFNQQTGVATASGDVEMDLQGVTYSAARAASGESADPERGTVHLRTRGLTFSQKTGVAKTADHTEFRLPQAEGSATGARYDSAAGVLTLQSEVTLHTSVKGDVHTLTAAHAVLERATHLVTLEHAQLQSTDRGMAAEHAVLQVDEDGTVRTVQASGGVRVQTDSGQQAEAPRGSAVLADGALHSIHMEGGVRFAQDPAQADEQSQRASGRQHARETTEATRAQTADLLFGARNGLEAVKLRGSVQMDQSAPGVTRKLQAAAVDIAFAGKHPLSALASGEPVFDEQQTGPRGTQERNMRAETIQAMLDGSGQITALHGSAGAHVASTAADGAVEQSWADDLRASFAGTGKDRALRTVQEQGHVRLEQTAHKPGQPEKQTATAQSANYDAAADTVLLSGSPRWTDGSMALSADRVTLHRGAGTALAEGNVKSTYSGGSAGPAAGARNGAEASHVIAESALFHSADHTALFRGNARLWQGDNSVTAPTIRLAGVTHELTAEGGADGAAGVRAVLITQPQPGARGGRDRGPDQVLITSAKLVYSDSAHTGHFSGGVALHTRDATVRSQSLDAYMAQNSAAGAGVAPARTGVGSAPELGGKLERAVARGRVMLQQPGRSGSGDELVYTAADGVSVLTGSTARPPRLDDAVKGSVTGESLVFGSKDESVRVEGGHGRTAATTYTGKQ